MTWLNFTADPALAKFKPKFNLIPIGDLYVWRVAA